MGSNRWPKPKPSVHVVNGVTQTICSKPHALMSVFKDVRHDDALTGFADVVMKFASCRPGQEARVA